jgi:hypothetical protein
MKGDLGINLHLRTLIHSGRKRYMNVRNLKKYTLALTLAAGFVVASGPVNLVTVQAQDRPYNRDRPYDQDRRDGGRDRRGNREDQGKGYRDGLNRGQEDSRSRRRANPNNSEHFRDGNRWYKGGFRRGYNVGYRQNRRW